MPDIYRDMFTGRDGKTKIRPTIVKRDRDEYTVVKKGKNKNEDITFTKYRDKIETVYLIRDAYDAYKYEPDTSDNALEFHVIYDKNTGKSTGTLYYNVYDIGYTRQTGAKVQDAYEEELKQAHEGYECSDLSRYKVQFFPPEINSINALSKYLEHRLDGDLMYSRIISVIEMEALKQTLREHFGLDQNTEILTYLFTTNKSSTLNEDSNNEYFLGAAFFNDRFFLFREFANKKLELLECEPVQKIKTRKDFERLTEYCLYEIHYGYCFTDKKYFRDSVAMLLNDPELFRQEKKPKPLKSGASKKKRMKHIASLNQISEEEERKAKEKGVIKLDMNYKETLIESNRERPDPVLDSLISSKIETLALQGYKHFTRKDIGFEYKCVDNLKIQHNIQGKQRISLAGKKLQFFKKQQLEQQLDNLQNARNEELQAEARLHD